MAECRKTLRVMNRQGLHARPCHSIVSASLPFQSDVRIRSGEREVNGKSILELMTLSAVLGAELDVRIRGRDAEELMTALEELFAAGFGEELA